MRSEIRSFFNRTFSAFTFAQGKLAIVIDDIGYHPKEDAEVLAMPKEVSVAIIPAAPYAKITQSRSKSAESRYSHSYANAACQQH